MVLKIIGQLLLLGTKIISGTFRQTFKQITANVNQKSAAAATVKMPSTMSLDEAHKILNVAKNVSGEELQTKFEATFKANDRKSGGSFYLQSKIVRARERIEIEREANNNDSSNGGSVVAAC